MSTMHPPNDIDEFLRWVTRRSITYVPSETGPVNPEITRQALTAALLEMGHRGERYVEWGVDQLLAIWPTMPAEAAIPIAEMWAMITHFNDSPDLDDQQLYLTCVALVIRTYQNWN